MYLDTHVNTEIKVHLCLDANTLTKYYSLSEKCIKSSVKKKKRRL